MGATRGNVGTAPGSLVGRDRLVASVAGLVEVTPLVTLTGVGGVGKTRLAVEVATTVEPRFGDGAWLVDLAAVVDAAAVPDAIASVLGVTPQAETSMAHTLGDALAGRHLLLVLDNCEHVLGASAELAERLVDRCGDLRILATSRERLQAAGEREVPVLPLAVHDAGSPAVELFTDRARAVRPNFSLEDHPGAADAVVEICRVLDGLPLGIELAAARMAGMGVADVRDRLGDRFRLLEGEPVVPARQRSLPELVRWSYELLDDAERGVLLQAAVFVGGFDVDAFTGVFAVDDDVAVLRALDRLVRKSLVVADHAGGRVRYRLLETIRQFGIDELSDAGLLDAGRDRHARWFASEIVARWDGWNGPGWGLAVDWVRTELANLRAACAWVGRREVETAADIAAYAALIGTTGNLFEPITWAENLLDAASAADIARLPRLLCACGYACFAGRAVTAAAHAERAMRLEAEPRYDSCEPGLSAFIAALANVYAGDLERYVALAAVADRCGGSALAFARPALVDGLQASGRVDEALGLIDSAVDAARNVASPFWLAYALWTAGLALSQVDPQRALSTWEEATEVVCEHGVDFFRGFLARDAARLHTTSGDVRAALEQFDVAIESFQRAGNIAQLVITLASVPALLARLGDHEEAATLQAAMTQIPASVGHVPELVDLEARLATQLGPAAGERAAAGRAMDLDAATGYARRRIDRARQPRSPGSERPGGLSGREVEVLRLVAEGLTTRRIADRLFISAKTADRHIQNIYTKIGTSNRATATRWAVDHGVVDGPRGGEVEPV